MQFCFIVHMSDRDVAGLKISNVMAGKMTFKLLLQDC